MPAAGTKKYEVTTTQGAGRPKGMWVWKPDGGKVENGDPTGNQVYIDVGETVMMTQEAAQPLVDIGRLRPVGG